jgi:hypothetical protein
VAGLDVYLPPFLFIAYWRLKSIHVALRRPETMRINHEETKGTKKRPEKNFVLFVSSWLIL